MANLPSGLKTFEANDTVLRKAQNDNIEAIDKLFDPSQGHKHTGQPGDAPKIGSSGLDDLTGTLTLKQGAGIRIQHPANSQAALNIDWNNSKPRIVIGGDGAGSQEAFQIQGAGNTVRFEVDKNGNGKLGGNEIWHKGNLKAQRIDHFRVLSMGLGAIPPAQPIGVYKNGTNVFYPGRSYGVTVIDRATHGVVSNTTYDVFGGTANAQAMANALNNLGSDKLVIITTYDEPQGNRLSGGLEAAIRRCGGSRAIFSSDYFPYRGAYILVGIPGIGEGNGLERISPTGDNGGAWQEMGFSLVDGNLTTAGNGISPVVNGGINFRSTSGFLEYNDGSGWKGLGVKSIQRGHVWLYDSNTTYFDIAPVNIAKTVINVSSSGYSYEWKTDRYLVHAATAKGFMSTSTQIGFQANGFFTYDFCAIAYEVIEYA